MTAKITTLIGTASFEVIRDKIALILFEEIAAQQVIAVADEEDPAMWKARVFTERNSPWEEFLNAPTDTSPIINVSFNDATFDGFAGNRYEIQASLSRYWIDCIGYGKAASTGATGHIPGDEASAIAAHRAGRLVRSILMSAPWIDLGLSGTVTDKKVTRVSSNKPNSQDSAIQNITAVRVELEVRHSELSPQNALGVLEEIRGIVYRGTTGQILANVTYEYPDPEEE